MASMYLFLDFDGVLRPDWAPRGRFHQPCLERFESTMRDFPRIDIVISSDWRWQARLKTIVAMFSPDIGARIIGVTPLMPSDDDGMRHREIVAYLEERLLRGEAQVASEHGDGLPSWLAIDDKPSLFTDEVIGRQVLITDPDRAFDAAFEAKLRTVLAARCGGV